MDLRDLSRESLDDMKRVLVIEIERLNSIAASRKLFPYEEARVNVFRRMVAAVEGALSFKKDVDFEGDSREFDALCGD